MNTLGLILGLAAVTSASILPHHTAVPSHHTAVPASVAVRAPAHDSAIIQSHRLGGNFAYRTDEAHAYAVKTPVLGQRTVPVGVSYHRGTPIVKTSTDYVSQLVPQTGVATYQAPAQVISRPIVAQRPVAVAPAVHAAYAPAVAPATYAQAAAVPAVHGGVYAAGLQAAGGYAVPSAGVYTQGIQAAGGYAVPSVGVYTQGIQSAGGYAVPSLSAGGYAAGAYAVPSAGVYTQGVQAAGGYAIPSAGVYAQGLPSTGAYAHGLTGYQVASKSDY